MTLLIAIVCPLVRRELRRGAGPPQAARNAASGQRIAGLVGRMGGGAPRSLGCVAPGPNGLARPACAKPELRFGEGRCARHRAARRACPKGRLASINGVIIPAPRY